MGLSPFSWVIMEPRLHKLTEGVSGEADIIAGSLAFTDVHEFERKCRVQTHAFLAAKSTPFLALERSR